jgi:hypothetical protein
MYSKLARFKLVGFYCLPGRFGDENKDGKQMRSRTAMAGSHSRFCALGIDLGEQLPDVGTAERTRVAIRTSEGHAQAPT